MSKDATSAQTVGHVTRKRYEEQPAQARELVEIRSCCQLALGDKGDDEDRHRN